MGQYQVLLSRSVSTCVDAWHSPNFSRNLNFIETVCPVLYVNKMVRVDSPGYSVISGPVLHPHIPAQYNWMSEWFPYLISISNTGLTLPSYVHPKTCQMLSLPFYEPESGAKDSFSWHPITGIFPQELCFHSQPLSHISTSPDKQTWFLMIEGDFYDLQCRCLAFCQTTCASP